MSGPLLSLWPLDSPRDITTINCLNSTIDNFFSLRISSPLQTENYAWLQGNIFRCNKEQLDGRQQNLHPFSIQVISLVDRYWVECALELRQGVVPSANVAPVLLPPLQPGQQVRPWKTLLGHFWTFVCSGVHREGRPACETSRGRRSCQR